jgi:hypothetical protein
MAFTPDSSLRANSNILLRDQRHASRLFVDDQFRLAPKANWLFHVAFGINPAALKTIDIAQRHGNEIGMLVKSVTLPKFTMATDQVNQYNRKKQIQRQHKFESSTIKFHDDNMSLINNLWQNYYSYYYADSTSAKKAGAYNRNAIRNFDSITSNYGLDNGSTTPFFTYIKIYQMARHEYVSYTLHNPIIQSWDHATVNYEDKNLHDFTMMVGYEAVSYGSGEVTAGDPIGFGLEHYDTTPSPLQSMGRADNASPSFLNNANLTNNATSFLANLVATNNAYANNQQVNNSAGIGTGTTTTNQTTGGIQDTAFPTTNSSNNTTKASNSTVGQ